VCLLWLYFMVSGYAVWFKLRMCIPCTHCLVTAYFARRGSFFIVSDMLGLPFIQWKPYLRGYFITGGIAEHHFIPCFTMPLNTTTSHFGNWINQLNATILCALKSIGFLTAFYSSGRLKRDVVWTRLSSAWMRKKFIVFHTYKLSGKYMNHHLVSSLEFAHRAYLWVSYDSE
jgi:hypothetical protein